MINRLHTFAASASLLIASLVVLTPARAGIVRFTATINAAQETTSSTSPATGTAVLLYDVNKNTFTLTVSIVDFANTITASHIHEGAVGVAGAVVTGLGAETSYTRSGANNDVISGTFANITHGGSAATLLSGGAYLNFHSASFPGGEIRGQLIPDVVHLSAVMSGANESPARTTNATGAIQATYDPLTNKISTLVYLYNFTHTLTNSHIHEASPGVNGSVVVPWGAAAAYIQNGNTYTHYFPDLVYTGSPVTLLSEGSYANAHSDIYPGGEIRGQISIVNPDTAGRLVNVSSRGHVGVGDDVLITGFVVGGSGPARVLATGRGPFLSQFGVSGVLANPLLSIYDTAGRLLLTNDDIANTPNLALVTGSGLAPSDANESAIMLVLPPGAYTAIVSGAGNSTGIALAEAFEMSW